MKEFEKLLQLEDNRKNNIKAKTMVKLGLFEQETLESFSFENLELITIEGKKYRGIYDLYESHDGQLTYVNAKTEDENLTDAYAYDVIKIDNVTDLEYAEILEAGRRERSGLIKTSRVILLITTVLTIASTLYAILSGIIGKQNIFVVFANQAISYAFIGIQVGLYIVSEIAYRKFYIE